MQSFADALTAEMASAGHRQRDVAAITGISQTAVSQLCKGDRSPHISTAAKLMGLYPRLLVWLACCIHEMGRAEKP